MSLKKQIPQIITSCNLLCGCVAAVFALQGNYPLALAFIVGGAVFDFFDGFAARLLGVAGPFGRELDSLADDITFGFAPAAVVASLLGEATFPGLPPAMAAYMPWAGFLIAAFSALRLAKFNLDERQTMGFIGLPTPANALFWASLALGLHDDIAHIACGGWLVLAGIVLSCWLLVSEIPMFALKFKHFGWRDNRLRYVFIFLAGFLVGAFGWRGLPFVVVLYVLLSLAANARKH